MDFHEICHRGVLLNCQQNTIFVEVGKLQQDALHEDLHAFMQVS